MNLLKKDLNHKGEFIVKVMGEEKACGVVFIISNLMQRYGYLYVFV